MHHWKMSDGKTAYLIGVKLRLSFFCPLILLTLIVAYYYQLTDNI